MIYRPDNTLIQDDEVHVPAEVVDLESFRRWAHSDGFPKRGKISYIGGEIDIDMSPEEIETHNKVKRDVAGGLWTYLQSSDLGELLFDGVLLVNQEADLSTEPDLVFCSWESLRSGRVRYQEWVEGSQRFVEVNGAPDVVVEIISRSSLRKDTIQLPERYFAAGIPEYWLIDARGEEIDFQLHVRGETAYEPAIPDGDGFRVSRVLQQAFHISRSRNPVGRFRYTLAFRDP